MIVQLPLERDTLVKEICVSLGSSNDISFEIDPKWAPPSLAFRVRAESHRWLSKRRDDVIRGMYDRNKSNPVENPREETTSQKRDR